MDFESYFGHTEKGMNPRSVLMILNGHHKCPLVFFNPFEETSAELVLHNYEFVVILRKSLLLYPLARKRDERGDLPNSFKMFLDDLP